MIKSLYVSLCLLIFLAPKMAFPTTYCLCQNAGKPITKQCFALFSSSTQEQNAVCAAECKRLPQTPIFTGMIGVDIQDFSGTPRC